MQIKFFNTEIHIQHLKIGTVVSYNDSYSGVQYGHIVGFDQFRYNPGFGTNAITRVWVQFEQELDCAEAVFTKTRIKTTELELVGH